MEIDPGRLAMLANPATDDGRASLEALFDAFQDDMRGKLARLRGAVDAGDAAAVRKIAHEQKGAAGMVGASGLAAIFRDIEVASTDPAAVTRALAPIEEKLARIRTEVDDFLRRSVMT